LLPASFTVTPSALAKAVLIVADCGVVPAFAVIVVGAPAVFVSEKLAKVATPATDAVTLYGPPAVLFAVNGAAATPDAFVATVIVAVLLLNTPEAPEPGAVNVTFTPLTGLLRESLTVACSWAANAVPTVALCGVPAVAAMLAAVPAPPLPAARKATICITHGCTVFRVAVAL
jgi:hypothetical protein